MLHLRKVVLLLTLLCIVASAHSQSRFIFNMGGVVPMGHLADDDVEDPKKFGAKFGIGGGLMYNYTFTDYGLGAYGSLHVAYNGTKREYKQELEEYLKNFGFNEVTNFSEFFNIPVSLGLSNTQSVNNMDFVVNLGLAVNFLKMTNFEDKQGIYPVREEYNLTPITGATIGGGVIFNNKVYLNINYYNYSNTKVKGVLYAFGQTDKFDFSMKPSYLTLNLGLVY